MNNNIDIEKEILGSILNYPDSLLEIETEPFYFFNETNKTIYETMVYMLGENIPIDILMLNNTLKQLGQKVPPVYLMELKSENSTAANIVHHSLYLKELYIKRKLIEIAQITINECKGDGDIFDILEKSQQAILDISISKRNNGNTIDVILKKTLEDIEAIKSEGENPSIIKTGFHGLDDIILGLKKQDLYIFAGRPSMGKTSFALNIAENISKNKWVAFFSIEMGGKSLAMKTLAGETGIPSNVLLSGSFSSGSGANISRAAHKIMGLKIYIDDTPGLSTLELNTRARVLKQKYDIQVLIVDYLQLMRYGKGLNREREISEISMCLKSLAKSLDIPVIALSQLNRSVETRTDKRPKLSDLRESGSIEQDADTVIFLYRPEVYGILQDNYGNPTEDIAEIIVAKQRNGAIGSFTLNFDKARTKFSNPFIEELL